MRNIPASPEERAIDLAARYGMQPSVISNIRRGKGWQRVTQLDLE